MAKVVYLTIDEGSQREVIKKVGKVLPDISVAILTQALVIKAINLSYLS